MYSNSWCSCLFEPEIIKIGLLSFKMYSNNMLNFQGSTTILNACTKKKRLETYWKHHVKTQHKKFRWLVLEYKIYTPTLCPPIYIHQINLLFRLGSDVICSLSFCISSPVPSTENIHFSISSAVPLISFIQNIHFCISSAVPMISSIRNIRILISSPVPMMSFIQNICFCISSPVPKISSTQKYSLLCGHGRGLLFSLFLSLLTSVVSSQQ